jgi:acyl-CoA dehydrogenase
MGEGLMLTEEQLEIRQLAREFAQGEIRPHVEAWDAARWIPEELFEKLAELGFLGMRIPEPYGGLAFDASTYLTVLEAMAWGDASVALSLSIHNGPVCRVILEHGTDGQKEQWLPLMATGQALAAFALSEEEAGSDPGALECRARPAGDGWVLDGSKAWVTNGDRAGLLLVFARTGQGTEGISAFLVPGNASGIQTEGRERTLGLSASETVSLRFQEVELPGEALLGEVGGGYGMAMDALIIGRLGVAAQALGIGQAAFEHAISYAGEREQFGRPLNRFGAIQEKLAGMAIRLAQARALTLEVAGRVDGGETASTGLPVSLKSSAAMAKVAASEAAMWVADEAVQIFGGYGYMRDYPVERLMRDAKGTEIYEGANEVLRWIVARDTVKESGTGD